MENATYKTMSNLDCRHVIAQKAANIFQRANVSCLLCDNNVMHHFLNRYAYSNFCMKRYLLQVGFSGFGNI